MSVTYVVLPFVRTEESIAAGQAQQIPNEGASILRKKARPRLRGRARRLGCASARRRWAHGNGGHRGLGPSIFVETMICRACSV